MSRVSFFSPGDPPAFLCLALAAVLFGASACGLDVEGNQFSASASGPSGAGGVGGAGAGGAAGSGGSAVVCSEGTAVACYEGPMTTLNVGPCKGGVKTCLGDGSGYGLCSGQVTPAYEDCVSEADEDCDGSNGTCTGEPAWSLRFGGGDFETGLGLAVDSDGYSVVTGFFQGSTNIGGEVSISKGSADVFVARFSPSGGRIWTRAFGSPDFDAGLAIAAAKNGSTFVVGQFRSTIDFGPGPFKSLGGEDIFLLKLDSKGNVVFAKRFGGDGDQLAVGVTVGADGGPAIAGYFTGSVAFDTSAPTLTSAGDVDIFVAKFGPAGEYQWSQRFGDGANQAAFAVAASADEESDGRIVVVGQASGVLDVGGIPLTPNAQDAFVFALDAKGKTIYARVLGDVSAQQAFGVAVDPLGDAFIAGDFQGKMPLGATELTSDGTDIFVAKLLPNGEPAWAKRLGGTGEQKVRGAALDPFGNLIITGNSYGEVGLDAGPLSSVSRDVLAVKLGPDGATIWGFLFGTGAQEQYGNEVATDPQGNVFITGEFDGDLVFGKDTRTAVGVRDGFLAKLAP